MLKKLGKDIRDFNNPDSIGIYRIYHPTTEEYIVFSSVHKVFIEIGYKLCNNNKYQQSLIIEMIQIMLSIKKKLN